MNRVARRSIVRSAARKNIFLSKPQEIAGAA
jgi:hypothetical protein